MTHTSLLICLLISTCATAGPILNHIIKPLQHQHAVRRISLQKEEGAIDACDTLVLPDDLASRYPWALPANRNTDYCQVQQAFTHMLQQAQEQGKIIRVVFYGDSLISSDCPSAEYIAAMAMAYLVKAAHMSKVTLCCMLEVKAAHMSKVTWCCSLRWDWAATAGASDVFRQYMDPYNGEALGIGKETASSLMWRILAGNIPVGVGTEVAVIVQYANDMWQAAYQSQDGPTKLAELLEVVAVRLLSIADYLIEKVPGLQVLIVQPLPPCAYIGEDQDWAMRYKQPNWLTDAVQQGAMYLEQLVQNATAAAQQAAPQIHVLSCWHSFVVGDGSMINPALTRDGVHPNGQGWDVLLGHCIMPKVRQLLRR